MTKITVDLTLKDRTKRSFLREADLMEARLEVPMLDPTALNPFDEHNNKIFQVVTRPVVNRVKEVDDGVFVPVTGLTDLRYASVKSEIVETVAKVKLAGEDYARINGSIDIPLKGVMKRASLENTYFTDQETANSVAMAVNEVGYERAFKMNEETTGAVNMLSELLDKYGDEESRRPLFSKKEKKSRQSDPDDISVQVMDKEGNITNLHASSED